jgi:hypothetical protein
MKNKIHPILTCCLVFSALLLASCASGKLKNAQELYRQGNVSGAAGVIGSLASGEKEGARDSELVFLEQGNMLATVGKSPSALEAFKKADRSITRHDETAKIQIGNEAGALLTNLNAKPYRTSPSERLMASAYLASTFVENNEIIPARAAVKLTKNRQKEIFAQFQRQIDKEQASLQQAMQNDPKVKVELDMGQVSAAQNKLEGAASKFKAYSNYSVPYADALSGVILGSGPNPEAGRAAESFRMALECHPSSGNLRRASNGSLAGTTNIFIEDGVAPKLGSFRFDIPIVINGSFTTLSAAFPTFEPQPLVGSLAELKVNGKSVKCDVICDFDRISGEEYRRKLPGTIARTMASSTLKAVAGIAAQMAAAQIGGDYGGIAKLGAGILSTGYNIASAQADQRIWATLPKQVRFACIPTPGGGEIEIGGQKVKLPSGSGNLVIARVINGQVHVRTAAL